jgi:hypothetical protein
MLEYTEVYKDECDKISVAVILLNSENPDENYDGTHHNLALVYHRFIKKYVLLVKEHKLFEVDKFVILKKTKEESERYLTRKNIINKVTKMLNLKPVIAIKTKKAKKARKEASKGGKPRNKSRTGAKTKKRRSHK